MWKNNLRKNYERKTYRKRYKCPKCDEYTLHIEHDSFGECENWGDDINSEEEISKIVKKDDFDGFYTSEEIKESFFDIDEDANGIMTMLRNRVKHDSIYSKKQVKGINEFFEKSWNIDELLDDYTIKYFRKFTEREKRDDVHGLNNEEYILNLIEDAHFFVNKAVNEMVLFEYSLKYKENIIIYPGTFFLSNCNFHIISSWERIINILSIIYDIEYDINNLKNNSFSRLHKKLRKNNKFQQSGIYKSLDNIKSNGMFKKVDDARKSNDHDISEYLTKISKLDDEKKNDPNFNFYNELIPDSKELLENIRVIYEALEEIIKYYDNMILNEDKHIHIIEELKVDYKTDYNSIIDEVNSKKDLRQHVELKCLFDDILSFLYKLKSIIKNKDNKESFAYLFDITSRLLEISKCLVDIGDCTNKSIYKTYPFEDYIINQQYFVYASIYRTYACYDKLGRAIVKNFDFKDIPEHYYFEDAVNILKTGEDTKYKEFASILSNVLTSKEFIDLSRYRNQIFHYIRPGAINGKEGLEIHEEKLIYLAYENANTILKLLEEFLKIM